MAGFTLVELLVAVFILQLIVAPLYLFFTSTKRTMFKAADTLIAANLASSMVAGLREQPRDVISSLPLCEDTAMVASLSLANLGVAPAPPEFSRKVTIIPVSEGGEAGLYLVEVHISWFNRNTTTPASYFVRNLLRGKK
jgi:prepilin-type N-terminal cleavage/methylation domain-containing protein